MSAPDPGNVLTQVTSKLKAQLGANLYSLAVYGSYVRGNFRRGVSDLNLLIILNESTAAAHQAIATIISSENLVDPFILERQGLDRTMKVFPLKFLSIKRNYKIVQGADPFAGLKVAPQLAKIMCEQSLRNLELRLTHAFVVSGHERKPFSRRLSHLATAVFVDLSELARLSGASVPNDLPSRIPVIEKVLGQAYPILATMLDLKSKPRTLSSEDVARTYGDLLNILNRAIRWTEANWQHPLFQDSNP